MHMRHTDYTHAHDKDMHLFCSDITRCPMYVGYAVIHMFMLVCECITMTMKISVPTLLARLTSALASISVFTTSGCPFELAMSNGLQPFCSRNATIIRGFGGEY